jgi:Mitochondrial inner membrane protein
MASDDRDSSESGRPPGGRRRRPPPIIEGTASEVASEPVVPPPEPVASPTPDPEPPPVEAAGETAPPDAAPGPAPAEKPTQTQTERPFEQAPAWLPIDRPRALVAGGLAGAGASVAILVVLWLVGAFTPRDDAAALAGQVATLEAKVRDLAARPAPSDAKALADLRARVDVIDAGLRRVDDRLARAEAALATPRSAPTDPAVLERLGAAESLQRALNATIADLRHRIDDLAAVARDAKTRAEAASEAAFKAPQADAALRTEVEALAARVAALEHAGQTTDQRIDQSMTGASSDRVVRLAVVADALRAAVARGTPFAAELAAAKALGADAAALGPLEAVAAAGVPTAETLAQDLDKLAPAMLAAAAPPTHDGGILDRLQANAERLVRIHPIGETAGDDPAAGLARANAKARRGDIAGALAEVERLPPAVKAPAADWIKAAQARVAAIDAARQLLAASLAGLGKPSP